jgi:hypothetical protein
MVLLDGGPADLLGLRLQGLLRLGVYQADGTGRLARRLALRLGSTADDKE